MAQAELVQCPNCQNQLWLPPGFAGFRCEYCGVHVGFRRPEPYYRPNPPEPYYRPNPVGNRPIMPGARNFNKPGYFNKPRHESIIVNPPPLIRVSGNKRAVLCGISYKNTKHELKGCINDVNCMKYLLMTKFSFPEDSIIVLTEEEEDSKRIPTRQNMQRWMRWLVQDCRAGDSLVFHYSGHGSQQEEDYSGEEVDGYDETLLPVDFETAGMIVDNEINETLVRPLPPGARLHAIIDACHSGTVLDLPYVCVFNPRQGDCAWEDHTPQNGVCKATSGGEAISFSGCEDDQTSADTKALSKIQSTGAMTFSFIKAVEKGEGKTYGTLLSYMRDSVRAARQKPKNPTVLTNMLYEGGSQKQGKIQEPQLSSSYPFDINDKPFYL